MKTIPALGLDNVAYFGSKDENIYAIHYTDENVKPVPMEETGGGSGDSLGAGGISGIAVAALTVSALVLGLIYWVRGKK